MVGGMTLFRVSGWFRVAHGFSGPALHFSHELSFLHFKFVAHFMLWIDTK